MSNNIIRFLPNLTFNNSFIEEFVLGNDTSCSTLGTVEEMKKEIGFVAIRPEKPIPEDILSKGFNLGQQMRGN
ncbi:MAG: hypothetical protein ISS11_08505, partial [Candidatus Marinimicrobia bacterium]|nr:hypothetical protein [Candidatus Neomarinimicrobiota bacterium]